MPRTQLERARVPAALILIFVAAFVMWPRGDATPVSGSATPSEEVVVGQPGGEAVPVAPTQAPTAVPTLTPAPTPAPTAEPTPPPVVDAFTAEIVLCRSIRGGACRDPIGQLSPDARSFTALIRFTDAVAGDQMNAVLTGPAGTIAGTPYALQGSGDGYFWAEFIAGGLPAGDYVVTAVRNETEVASTAFSKVGG